MTYDAANRDANGAAAEFQSLSPLAALALVLGLISPAALASPLLLAVPAAAIGVAALALVKIRAAEGGQAGAALARCGLALGVACIVSSLVRVPVRDALMRRQAHAVGREWLALLAEGRTDESVALMSSGAIQSIGPAQQNPAAPSPTLEQAMNTVHANLRSDATALEMQQLKPPLRFVVTSAPGSRPEFDGPRVYLMEDFTAYDSDGQHRRVQLRLSRSRLSESEGRAWRVDSWSVQRDAPADGQPLAPAAGSRSS